MLRLSVEEEKQGQDLNSDGDTADWIDHLHDFQRGETTNLGRLGYVAGRIGKWILFHVSERFDVEGGADLNRDGDMEDRVCLLLNWSLVESLPRFVRGDCNDDRVINLSDGVCILEWLFCGGESPACLPVANTNGDGALDITDAIHLLRYLFLGGPPAAVPYHACGPGLLERDPAFPCDRAAEACR